MILGWRSWPPASNGSISTSFKSPRSSISEYVSQSKPESGTTVTLGSASRGLFEDVSDTDRISGRICSTFKYSKYRSHSSKIMSFWTLLDGSSSNALESAPGPDNREWRNEVCVWQENFQKLTRERLNDNFLVSRSNTFTRKKGRRYSICCLCVLDWDTVTNGRSLWAKERFPFLCWRKRGNFRRFAWITPQTCLQIERRWTWARNREWMKGRWCSTHYNSLASILARSNDFQIKTGAIDKCTNKFGRHCIPMHPRRSNLSLPTLLKLNERSLSQVCQTHKLIASITFLEFVWR